MAISIFIVILNVIYLLTGIFDALVERQVSAFTVGLAIPSADGDADDEQRVMDDLKVYGQNIRIIFGISSVLPIGALIIV